MPLDEARRLFDVRFWGAVTAVRHAAPRIRAGGSVVLTSGTVAVRPSAGAALMAGAAAAIEGLTRGLAVELAPVRVNAVRPGAIHTPMWDAAPEPQRSALLGALAERTITKTVGEPGDIAAAHLIPDGQPLRHRHRAHRRRRCPPALTLSGSRGATGQRCG